MKRNVLILFLLLAIALAAAPYGIGMVVEQQLHAQQQQIRDSYRMPHWMSGGVENYRRGWLSASADTVWTIDLHAHPGLREMMKSPSAGLPLPDSVRIVVRHDIRHGPLILSPAAAVVAARVESSLEVPEVFRSLMAQSLSEQPLATGMTDVFLTGGSVTTVTVPAWSGSPAAGLTVDWQGFSGTARGNWFDIDGTFEGEAPLLELRVGDHAFAIRSTKVQSEARLSEYGFLAGVSRMVIAEAGGTLTLPEGASQAYAVEDAELAFASALEGDLIEGYQRFGFARARIGDVAAGPGELRLALRNVDAPVVMDLADEFDRLAMEQGMPYAPGLGMSERMRTLVPALLKRSPAFEITARLGLPQGEVSGHLEIVFDGFGEIDLDAPERLATLVAIDGEVSVPSALAMQVACSLVERQIEAAALAEGQSPPALPPAELERVATGMLAELERNGVLQREGDHHRVAFRLDDGQGSLNGNPVFTVNDLLAAAAARRAAGR